MPKLEDVIADKKTYPDETKITLAEGTEVTLGELRGGFMKDADYRQKTSTLARQREEFDQDYARRKAELADAEERLQELAKQVVQAKPEITRDEVAEVLERDPVARRLVGRIQQLEEALKPLASAVLGIDQRMKQGQLEYVAEQHRRALAWLKEQDPDLDENALVEFARKEYIPNLVHAHKVFKYEESLKKAREDAKAEGHKEGYDKAKKEVSAPVIPLRRPVVVSPDAPKTLDEAVQRASQDLEVMGPLLGIETPG